MPPTTEEQVAVETIPAPNTSLKKAVGIVPEHKALQTIESLASHHHSAHVSVLNALTQLQRDLGGLRKHGSPRMDEIAQLAERTWKANVMYENHMERVKREKAQLYHIIDSIWLQFDELILPLWRVDDSLVPIYEELAAIRRELEQILSTPFDDKRADTIRHLQSRLHNIENQYVIDGKFVPDGWSKMGGKIPSGQAIVASLLTRCYRLVRLAVESESIVDPTLIPIQNRLENIILHLSTIKESLDEGANVDPLELRFVQEHLDAIDRGAVEGKFLDADGNIPEGQATIHEQLEEAYDLVHECLVEMEARKDSEDASSVIGVLTERATEVRDTALGYLGSAAKGVTDYSASAIYGLRDTLAEGTTVVRRALGDPVGTARGATTQLASATRSAFGYLGRILEEIEPVDPSLMDVALHLGRIRRALKRLRNDRNAEQVRLSGGSPLPANANLEMLAAEIEDRQHRKDRFHQKLVELQKQLDEIDAKRSDGKFLNAAGEAARGQALLHNLLEECYCLVYYLNVAEDGEGGALEDDVVDAL
ncbi:hypothetical protein HK102_007638 [Quaeritorhiza haematococci]|nr:hypothetical protein HK102_007638 [Quaeritorhiza haematococci]